MRCGVVRCGAVWCVMRAALATHGQLPARPPACWSSPPAPAPPALPLCAPHCSYLTINCNSKESSEVHLLPASLRWPDDEAGAAVASTRAAAVPSSISGSSGGNGSRGGGPGSATIAGEAAAAAAAVRAAAAAPSPLSSPWARPCLVQGRTPGLEYCVEHADGQLYVLSTAEEDKADGYSLHRCAFHGAFVPRTMHAHALRGGQGGAV